MLLLKHLILELAIDTFFESVSLAFSQPPFTATDLYLEELLTEGITFVPDSEVATVLAEMRARGIMVDYSGDQEWDDEDGVWGDVWYGIEKTSK
jgi:hypothetical protein